MEARCISAKNEISKAIPVIGVFATCDPRIDPSARERAGNIVKLHANKLADAIKLPDGRMVPVVYSDLLIDTEKEADKVAQSFKAAGVTILVGLPDTWAFPQLTLLSLLAHFPKDTPLNFTCGNSGPKPGVVFTHAVSGAVAQTGRLMHINVGSWPDDGLMPEMTDGTFNSLVDWLYAAATFQFVKGKRVMVFGHDSMGMETALQHVIPTRNTFGIEIARLDMKLLADMLKKKAYDQEELKALRNWIDTGFGKVDCPSNEDSARFNDSLAMYLITRDLMKDLDAIGGGFMSQLEWGSDKRGTPLPVADAMESLFNSTFDHNGPKPAVPFATEADMQGLLTMVFFTYLSGGNPPLFMDFRKVWEPWEIKALAEKLNLKLPQDAKWATRGFVDGNNSGSASFNWAGMPGEASKSVTPRISFPLADPDYFPGMGNSVTFLTPGGIRGLAGRLSYSVLSGLFSMIWDEAETVELPEALANAVCNKTNATWPHTLLTPDFASMAEYKHYAPANHLHMTWNLPVARLQYWMDLANVLSVTPWQAKPAFRENIDRPLPLLYLLNGGETQTKILRKA
jgi:L-fucose/D-arabinose isomerase